MSSRGIFAAFPNLRGGLPSKEKKKSKKGKEGRLARTMMNVTKFGIEGGKVSLPSLPIFPFVFPPCNYHHEPTLDANNYTLPYFHQISTKKDLFFK